MIYACRRALRTLVRTFRLLLSPIFFDNPSRLGPIAEITARGERVFHFPLASVIVFFLMAVGLVFLTYASAGIVLRLSPVSTEIPISQSLIVQSMPFLAVVSGYLFLAHRTSRSLVMPISLSDLFAPAICALRSYHLGLSLIALFAVNGTARSSGDVLRDVCLMAGVLALFYVLLSGILLLTDSVLPMFSRMLKASGER